ncbi:cation:proton antiporter [Photobacterium alginatilyticum]|uniref:Cation:proton antiporter n=1 Tax=Photobacterium alginatilyticum TaxID=1775171 RepID=A0ABW9YBM9_9GAMM|nr:cation:proton antiporter [Photobacterium alginatilyticum]NBI51189.1 cation:proton antiporter [Photobacterium alginatilyticum]
MELFFVLLILLVTTRIFGEIAEQLGQPSLVGELIAGITLGALAAQFQTELFPQLDELGSSPVFNTITELGMFFIMLLAGIELQPSRLIEYSRDALAVAVSGMILPMALGIGLGWLFLPASDAFFAQCVFLGTALTITAVPATVRILMDLGKLNSRSGQIIVSAAVFDDVLSLLLLAWLTALISADPQANSFELLPLIAKVVSFFVITFIVGVFVFPFGGRFIGAIKQREFKFSALLVGAMAFSVLAELLDLHFIIGAFMAGLFFDRRTINESAYIEVRYKTSAMTYGFLAPIFFASVGLHLDLSAVFTVPLFVVSLLLAAFFGKFIAAGAAARWMGLSWQDSAAVGVGMSARGAVELVIADIALKAGLFSNLTVSSPVAENIYSAVVIMAVITTLMTPILLKYIYSSKT